MTTQLVSLSPIPPVSQSPIPPLHTAMKNFRPVKHNYTRSDRRHLSQFAIANLPLVILFLAAFLLTLPVTREHMIWMLAENRPVELLTFVFLIAGGIRGVILTWQLQRANESKIIVAFYLLFSLALLVIGAEEVAWGQWFVGFETPVALSEINTQNELTLHNLEIFNDHLEIFPLLYGVWGLVSIGLNKSFRFYKIASPPILLSWYLAIAIVSAIDLFQDFFVLQEQFDYLINHLDEAIEMLVGIAGFLYIWLNAKLFKFS